MHFSNNLGLLPAGTDNSSQRDLNHVWTKSPALGKIRAGQSTGSNDEAVLFTIEYFSC